MVVVFNNGALMRVRRGEGTAGQPLFRFTLTAPDGEISEGFIYERDLPQEVE